MSAPVGKPDCSLNSRSLVSSSSPPFPSFFPFLSSLVLGPRALCFPLLAKGDCEYFTLINPITRFIAQPSGTKASSKWKLLSAGLTWRHRSIELNGRGSRTGGRKVLARFVPNQRFSRRSKVEVINRALGRTSSDY